MKFWPSSVSQLVASVVLVMVSRTGSAETGMTVRVSGGLIGGKASGAGALFAGVPFAMPPVGPLRWQPPLPVEPWEGVRDATSPSHDDFQPDEGWNHPMVLNSSEDCLYLNVLTPQWPASGKLPVILFVHGGGNFAGGGWEHLSYGVTLQKQGLVVVTVNYRLGIFGFFAHPGLTAESPRHASGNYALLDVVAALRWVRGNIAQFGGDPDNVTMMGQSAGALDICYLMASEEARGLFSRAIVESTPGLGPRDTQTLSQAEEAGSAFAARLGRPDIASLRAIPAGDLLAAAEQEHLRGRIDVDGWILKEPPAAVFAAGRESRLPMLIGTNARESSFKGTADGLRELVAARYRSVAPSALKLYGLTSDSGPLLPDPVLGDAGAQYLTDTTFRLPTLLLSQWHSAAGADVWMYLFSQTPKGREALGASHSSELPYVFGELGTPPAGTEYRAEDLRVSGEMQRFWANFAKTGNPNGPTLPHWPLYSAQVRAFLEFKGNGSTVATDLRQPYFELYRKDFDSRLGH